MDKVTNPNDGDTRAFGNTPEVEPETDKDGRVTASQEEQENYDMIVSRAIKIIHGEGQDDILKLMGASESPAEGMGRVTADIIRVIYQSAKEGQRDITPEVLMYAGVEIIQELSEFGQARGVFEYEDTDEEATQIQDAGMYATQFYGKAEQAAGEIPPEMKSQAQQKVASEIEKEKGPAEAAPVDNAGIINGISGAE